MNIPNNIQYLEIYYDGRCGMCCTFHEWVNRQERAFPVRFVTYQSPEAEECLPGISEMEPGRDMIVRTDDGHIYRAAEGWVLCLLSCNRYQGLARLLATPALLPFAKKICRALAARRHGISRVLFRKKGKMIATTLHQIPREGITESFPHDIPDGII